MKRIIKTVKSVRKGYVGKEIRYITFEGENTPKEVLKRISFQMNSHRYLALLYHEAKEVETILELGIGAGMSTNSLLMGCRDGRQGHLWSVDWGSGSTVAKIRKSELSKYFTWIHKDVFAIPRTWFEKHPIDLIWIDLDNANYKELMKRLILSMHKGSKLLMHNINAKRGEKEAVEAYGAMPGFSYEAITLGHGLGILTKVI